MKAEALRVEAQAIQKNAASTSLIINRNLLGDELLAPEKLCGVLFGTGKLKITMKHHTACCECQDYTNKQLVPTTHVSQNFKPLAANCTCLAYKIKLCKHAVEKNFCSGT